MFKIRNWCTGLVDLPYKMVKLEFRRQVHCFLYRVGRRSFEEASQSGARRGKEAVSSSYYQGFRLRPDVYSKIFWTKDLAFSFSEGMRERLANLAFSLSKLLSLGNCDLSLGHG
jgi:hypothetical protein